MWGDILKFTCTLSNFDVGGVFWSSLVLCQILMGGGILNFRIGVFCRIWTKISTTPAGSCITDSLSHTMYVETNKNKNPPGLPLFVYIGENVQSHVACSKNPWILNLVTLDLVEESVLQSMNPSWSNVGWSLVKSLWLGPSGRSRIPPPKGQQTRILLWAGWGEGWWWRSKQKFCCVASDQTGILLSWGETKTRIALCSKWPNRSEI